MFLFGGGLVKPMLLSCPHTIFILIDGRSVDHAVASFQGPFHLWETQNVEIAKGILLDLHECKSSNSDFFS